MTCWMRNQIANLHNAVSAPAAATRDALVERPQSVREATSLLYNRMMDNVEYGQERLKDIAENVARQEAEETKNKKKQ